MDADLSLAAAPDELVDIMLIDLDQISLEPLPQRQNYTGVFNFVTMDLSVAALCANNSQPPDCAQCIPGFTGSDCSVNIDDCARVNCSGNGVCIDGTNSFSCDCDPGFAGQMCDVMDVIDNNCQPNPCGLNGRCVDGPSNYTCLCSPGYSGPQCKQGIYSIHACGIEY